MLKHCSRIPVNTKKGQNYVRRDERDNSNQNWPLFGTFIT